MSDCVCVCLCIVVPTILCYLKFFVPCCDVPFDSSMKTMFRSSLPPNDEEHGPYQKRFITHLT
jgi:hypothetical protein